MKLSASITTAFFTIFLSLGSCVVPYQAAAVYRGEEGKRTPLIQPATPRANDARRLATHNADGMTCDEQQHNDS